MLWKCSKVSNSGFPSDFDYPFSFVQRLITQMYFEGDPLISLCPMINAIPDKKSRKFLISKLDFSKTESDKILAYNFNIVLRGVNQTYFETN